MKRYCADKEIRVFFPIGTLSVLKEASIKYSIKEQWLALIFWNFYKRLYLANKKNGCKNYVLVNSSVLFKIHKNYPIYMKALTECGLMVVHSQYSTHLNRSRSYRLGANYKIDGEKEIYLFYQKTVINSILRKKQPCISDLAAKFQYDNLFSININDMDAISWAYDEYFVKRKNPDSFVMIEYEIKKIKHGLRRFKIDEYDRIHTCFNGLPKYIRRNFLTYNENIIDLVELDIPACQPTLLWGMSRGELGEEKNKIKRALKKDIYNYLCRKYSDVYGCDKPRQFMKDKALIFYFGKLRFNCKSIKIIKNEFPSTYEWVSKIKKQYGYKYLSAILQKEESRIMSKVVSGLMQKNLHPFFTIHDCLAIPREISDEAEEIFLNCLHEEGYDWIKTLRKVRQGAKDEAI